MMMYRKSETSFYNKKERIMQKSNFALISALYSSKDAGLYKDIYFPIIKYSIVCLFYSDKKQEYYNLEDVQNFIIQEFGIKIPLIVH